MYESMGKRIELIRISMNMNKEEFAKLLGISGQYLGILEKGKSCLSYDKLKKLCNLTNLSADYILFARNTDITNETKYLLSDFTDAQIHHACMALEKVASFIRNSP